MSREANEYIRTFTGKKFYALDPRPEEIDIRDIAHALANNCRWGGHCKFFYSIAQHSCMVHDLVPWEHQGLGLMHDASEAYIMDMPRPIKMQMPHYREIEEIIMRRVAERFGFPFDSLPAVKGADDLALYVEKQSLFGDGEAKEVLTDKAVDFFFAHRVDADRWLYEQVPAWSPAKAEQEFLERYWALDRD
jgi:5'-nucleotidase